MLPQQEIIRILLPFFVNFTMKKTAVIAIDGPANILSPAQKKFNQLTQKIQELRETISIFQEDTQKIQLRARKDLVPLHTRFEEKKVAVESLENTIK